MVFLLLADSQFIKSSWARNCCEQLQSFYKDFTYYSIIYDMKREAADENAIEQGSGLQRFSGAVTPIL